MKIASLLQCCYPVCILLATTVFPFLRLEAQNFAEPDRLALETPPSKTKSIKSLAQFLSSGFSSETEKTRAIFAWVTLNIAYVDSSDERELWATPEHLLRQKPENVLRNRSAVCQGYANLFCALMQEAGIPCEVVTGLVKNADGEVEAIGHAWAAARVEGQWRLFDPTWAVPGPGLGRFEVQDQYFMADPVRFVMNHLPDDPVWQLLESPLSVNRFRTSDNQEILRFLKDGFESGFHFQDTLDQWVALDSIQRLFTAENRILNFNGQNDRVVFGLGQQYWGMFFDLKASLDSLLDESVLTDTVFIDTLWFERQMLHLEQYHRKAREIFTRLETPERIERAEKFYSPEDVAALFEKMRGDLRCGLFEYYLHGIPPGAPEEKDLAALQFHLQQARRHYEQAETGLNCKKMAGACFDIAHNRSLTSIQLAQRQLRFAQELANDDATHKKYKVLCQMIGQARDFLMDALEECDKMRRQPPQYAFVEERISTAKEGLLNLRACEIRVERTVLSPDIQTLLKSQDISLTKANQLATRLEAIATDIQKFQDTLGQEAAAYGTEFIEKTAFNLHLESFALQMNLANLRYRMALELYEEAWRKNRYEAQKEQIKRETQKALRAQKAAAVALDRLEDSGRLSSASIQLKNAQLSRLAESLQKFQAK